MSRCLSFVNVRSTSTDSSSKSHGTRYEWLPCNRLCEDSIPNGIQRLNTAGSGRPSKPPMSWLQKPNPDADSDSPPRSDSAIDSNVAELSPPQCTGNCWPPTVADRA